MNGDAGETYDPDVAAEEARVRDATEIGLVYSRG